MRCDLMPFNWKKKTLLCGRFASVDPRRPERVQVHTVTTVPILDKLLEYCEKRADTWASDFQIRLQGLPT